MVGERHDDDLGDVGRLNHATLDEPAEVDDERLPLVAAGDVGQRLPWLQRLDAIGRKCCLVDVGGAVVEVVGDEDGARVLGVADGVGGLTLPSFDRVEEHGHSPIVIE